MWIIGLFFIFEILNMPEERKEEQRKNPR